MAKRPAPVRKEELETKLRKVRIEDAIDNSPSLKEVTRALRFLKRAEKHEDAGNLPEPVGEAVQEAIDLLEQSLSTLGDAPKAGV